MHRLGMRWAASLLTGQNPHTNANMGGLHGVDA